MQGAAGRVAIVARSTRLAAVAGVAGLAAVWFITAMVAIINFGLRYPAFDQYHFYPKYLELPFQQAVLDLENGHRPVLPALVRWAEIQFLDAGQWLQMMVGLGFVVATIALIGLAGWGERRGALRAASAVLLAVSGVLWLGNARMVIHSNEIVAVYMVIAFGVAALWAVHAATRSHAGRWMGIAGLFALAAVFSFGSGMAAFAALFASAFAARIPWRAWIAPLILVGMAIALYTIGMPGDAGVRESLRWAPLDNLVIGLGWLSAPWVHAWLAFGDPSPLPWLEGISNSGATARVLGASATSVHAMFGADAHRIEGIVIGGFGLSAWFACLWHAWSRREPLARSRLVAFGVATMGLAVGAIVCLARLAHFQSSPGDVVAERYLPWSTLFWLGLALYGVCALRTPSWRRDAFAAAFAVAMAIVLYPSHAWWAGWAAAVHRSNQASAVAAQMGIWDPQRFPDGPDASKADVLETLVLLRERHLSMFGEAGHALWESSWTPPADLPSAGEQAWFRLQTTFDDEADRTIGRFEGVFPASVTPASDSVLVVVDASGARRGLAKVSFIGFNERALRFDRPQWRGFDGYLISPHPDERFEVLIVDAESGAVIGRVPLES